MTQAPAGEEVQLFWLADPRQQLLAVAADVLTSSELQRSAVFRRPSERERYLSAHVGLRLILARRLEIEPADVILGSAPCPLCGGPHGRPTVEGSPNLHFSLSYADAAALCAVAESPVGVDLESLQRPPSHPAAARRFHPDEQAALNALPQERRAGAFLGCWVRKEAVLKGTGAGLAGGLDTFVGLAQRDGGDGARGPTGWGLADLDVPAGYRGAVALQGERQPTFGWRSVRLPR